MRVIVCKDYSEMSEEAAVIVADSIKQNPNIVLGLATGSTPEGMYGCLSEMYSKKELDFSGVKTVNLDEYYPISPDNPQSYRYFMNYQLFDKVNIDKRNTYVPDGLSDNPDKFCMEYDKLIENLGGIDLQILGIGKNAHIGFNEPGDFLYSNTHLTDLKEETIEANSRFFESVDDVPRRAITMGMASIFCAKKIVILASGKEKHFALTKLLSNVIDTQYPASLLTVHPNVILICDKDAYRG